MNSLLLLNYITNYNVIKHKKLLSLNFFSFNFGNSLAYLKLKIILQD